MNDGEPRDLTARNYLGCLVGGTIGLLLCTWWPAAMLAGVVIGCVLGYWHREVPGIVINSYWTVHHFLQKLLPQKIQGRAKGSRWRLITILCRREIYQVNVIRYLVIVVHFAGLAAIFLGLLTWAGNALPAEAEPPPTVPGATSLAVACMGVFFGGTILVFWLGIIETASALGQDGSRASRRIECSRRLAWYRRGALRYAVRDMFLLLRSDVTQLLWLVGIIIAFVIELAIFVVFFLALVCGTVLTLRAMAYLATRPQCWLCIGVTIVVTILSASLLQEVTLPAQLLLLAALGNGVVAGLATNAIRRFMARHVVPARWYQWVVDISLKDVLSVHQPRCTQ